MQSGGIGGGSFMIIKDGNISKFLNCRETAPKSADKDMFEDSIDDSMYGGRAVAVPGEMKCFTTAHDKYGKLEWEKIIDPIINLVQDGIYMTKEMEGWILADDVYDTILGQSDFFKNPDGNPKLRGDKIVNHKLIQTFKKIR